MSEPAGASSVGRRAVTVRVLGVLALASVIVVGLWLGSRPLEPADRPDRPSPAAGAGTPSAKASEATPSAEPPPLDGLHVVLDPGHNGGNAENVAQINAQVGDGRGGAKSCNTVGTSTLTGYPEHAFTWDVAQRARDLLQADGARVTLTRSDDTSVGPCVDVRGRTAGDVDADVLVSIHANGSENPAAQGYFAIVSAPPLNEPQGEPSRALATALLGALGEAGFPPSGSYASALSERADLGTLNWAERPAVILELAEMRNPEEAELVQTEEGRQRYAEAVAAGLAAWAG
ncbi:N-acetylmuramoyl-L-alanine amidase [Georgenia subflava]|uniref:N-acetylmuramoyl-L-alanine amidase n=1 Tax=Georgenia subflava TaxID=1622177 RepID=A0A6N7ENH5_9MICO|nr:N-acetylmuramoyl-L-alanine amidase [Georgenia subflava]MPV38668.1 N-acetylmuramoyl-L-alanine amidase [Georgenia subflava]